MKRISTQLLMDACHDSCGYALPMQSAVNGQLGHWLQDGNACAVISFASGLVVMFLLLWREKKPGNNLRQFLL